MRLFALAAAAGLGLALMASAAEAKTFTDPHGRVIFDTPASWTMMDRSTNDFTHLIVGVANNECQILAFPSTNLNNVDARRVLRTAGNDAQFNAQFWATTANAVSGIFPDNSANVLSTSAEHDHPWPIQRAEIASPNNTDIIAPKTVHAGLQLRPGLEIYTYCMTYGGADTTDVYDAVIRSVRHPNDTTWNAEAQQQETAHTQAQAAATAAANAPPTTQMSCMNVTTDPANAGSAPASLNIVNHCSVEVKVYWIHGGPNGLVAASTTSRSGGRAVRTDPFPNPQYVASCPESDGNCNNVNQAAVNRMVGTAH